MLGVPDNFQKNQELSLENTFLKAARTRAERSWLKRKLVGVTLCDQIMGEAIPSRLDEDYNCQVILTMSVGIDAMQESAKLAELLQSLTKPLCVLRLTDGTAERYSFAVKRLSKTVAGEVVIEDVHATPEQSLVARGGAVEEWLTLADFSCLRNRSDKLAAYREWSTRAYVGTQSHLFSGSKALLASGGWYAADFAATVFSSYLRLEQLTREVGKANTLKEKTRINQEMRILMNRLEGMVQEQGTSNETEK